MNTNSNSYTIIYASVMVIIVAFLLAFVSSSLKERQDKNVELDKMKQILTSLNITDVEDAEKTYNQYIKSDLIIDLNGEESCVIIPPYEIENFNELLNMEIK